MADIIVYTIQQNEQHVPLTVRVEWQPNGSIKPLMYWLPDGVCYEVTFIYEMTHNAHLKHKGKGVRFKVKTEEMVYTDHKHILHETYLFFDDNFFCGKNFIDERYKHGGKEFIPVTLDVLPDGKYNLICFKVGGTLYMVENVISIEPRCSYKAGGAGLCHKIKARSVNEDNDRPAALYFEVNKWFIVSQTDSAAHNLHHT